MSEELSRSPITVISTVTGVLIAGLALLVAWLQYVSQISTPVLSSSGVVLQSKQLNLSNLGLGISFFLASTFSAGSLIRLAARHHDFAAFFLSIPAAVLTAFSSLVVLQLAPPRVMNATALASAQDLVFYGTMVVFIAINGLAVLRDLVSHTQSRDAEQEEKARTKDSGGGGLLVAALLLLIWGGVVSSGLSKLVMTFLTI